MDESEFDQFLKTRYAPDAPSNLASRIIEKSKVQPKHNPWHVKAISYLQGIAQRFSVPQPALAFATVLVLSVGLGLYGTDMLSVDPSPTYYSEADEVELAFYLDDIFETDDAL